MKLHPRRRSKRRTPAPTLHDLLRQPDADFDRLPDLEIRSGRIVTDGCRCAWGGWLCPAACRKPPVGHGKHRSRLSPPKPPRPWHSAAPACNYCRITPMP